jgi:hypothetical protein
LTFRSSCGSWLWPEPVDEAQDVGEQVSGNGDLRHLEGYIAPVAFSVTPCRYHANFSYRAASWTRARRVVAKVEWHPGELYPRVGLDRLHRSSVTNFARPAERVVVFYNQRGTAEQHIKEGKHAIRWTRLSCRKFAHNAVRLQLHALTYNLGNFLRTLALPDAVRHWSMTTLRGRLIKIVRHGRYVTFQMAGVAIPRDLFAYIRRRIDWLRRKPVPA